MQLPKFNNPKLLQQALTHRSAVNEKLGENHNERLEFLGDAVLELIVSEYLYRRFPEKPEGQLTTLRTALVRTETLAKIAEKLSIKNLLIISRGEDRAGGRHNISLLANAMEAIIGAIHLDQKITGAEKFIEEILLMDADNYIHKGIDLDTKSKFQEMVQAEGFLTPIYKIKNSTGPDHNRLFTAQVTVEGKNSGEGSGHSKQEAEQAAAKNAIQAWYNSPDVKNQAL